MGIAVTGSGKGKRPGRISALQGANSSAPPAGPRSIRQCCKRVRRFALERVGFCILRPPKSRQDSGSGGSRARLRPSRPSTKRSARSPSPLAPRDFIHYTPFVAALYRGQRRPGPNFPDSETSRGYREPPKRSKLPRSVPHTGFRVDLGEEGTKASFPRPALLPGREGSESLQDAHGLGVKGPFTKHGCSSEWSICGWKQARAEASPPHGDVNPQAGVQSLGVAPTEAQAPAETIQVDLGKLIF